MPTPATPVSTHDSPDILRDLVPGPSRRATSRAVEGTRSAEPLTINRTYFARAARTPPRLGVRTSMLINRTYFTPPRAGPSCHSTQAFIPIDRTYFGFRLARLAVLPSIPIDRTYFGATLDERSGHPRASFPPATRAEVIAADRSSGDLSIPIRPDILLRQASIRIIRPLTMFHPYDIPDHDDRRDMVSRQFSD